MRRAAIVLLGWGALLGAMTAAQLPFRTISGPLGLHGIEAAMLSAAALACFATGAAMWLHDARHRARERPRALTDESVATATLAGGLALALLGAGFGLWLILIGAGVTAAGAGGLVRETIARRRREGS